jgi:hypothetical protein
LNGHARSGEYRRAAKAIGVRDNERVWEHGLILRCKIIARPGSCLKEPGAFPRA